MNDTISHADLFRRLALGEDSQQQFKRDAHNADKLAAELAAFANSGGGRLFLGVADEGSVTGLTAADVRRLNQLLSNAASQHVRPPLNPRSRNIQTPNGVVIQVDVADGLSKPYIDHHGRIWVKQGADKRHVTSREEMQRMFQRSGLVYADTVPVDGAGAVDIDEKALGAFLAERHGAQAESAAKSPMQTMQNMGLASGNTLNLAGLMLFGRNPQRWRPAFEIKAVTFPGTELYDSQYLDSEDIGGTLPEQYRDAMPSFAVIYDMCRVIKGSTPWVNWRLHKKPLKNCWSMR